VTEKLELELVAKYPSFFRDYKGDMQETCMAWGMEHGDGWHKLFSELNERIAQYLSTHKNPPDFYWSQVKEKYGTARWYYNGGDDIISDLVDFYEGATVHTCETCGEGGKLRGKGWLYTSCNEHARVGDKDKEGEE
jgi:hypothetical protein